MQEPTPQREGAVGVQERPAPVHTDADDRERFAHIVFAPGRSAEAVVLESRITGTPVVALCGKRWIPSRDPKRFPVCPTCKEVADRLRRGDEDGGDADA